MSERDHGEGENVVRLPTEFRFEESPVRAVMYNDEPWFIAKDVCDILDIDDRARRSAALMMTKGVRLLFVPPAVRKRC